MAAAGIEIRSLSTDEELAGSVQVIRESFQTVADELGLTERNCPTHPSFMSFERLKAETVKGLRCFGLFTGGAQAGFVAAFPASADLFYLERLAVLLDYRHRGYGRILVDHVFSFARERGGKRISIAVIHESDVLKRWYSDYGFRETGTKVFPHLPFTVCFMEKETA
jgi:ribosomal protein S18 acetylase RimI-like enzyme